MTTSDPVITVDERYSMAGAPAVPWPEARRALESAGTYWLSTVRADGRPHVTPLIALWHGDALYFSAGPAEQKSRNLATNPQCILATGCNHLDDGLDVVVEGEAVQITDAARLAELSAAWEAKYGSAWHLAGSVDAPDLVFELTPVTAFGFRKGFGEGGSGCQTRWRWDHR